MSLKMKLQINFKGFYEIDPFEKFDPNDMSDLTTRRLIFIKM